MAGEPRREGIQQRPRLERRDAAGRRPTRLRHAAAERDAGVAAPSRERAPGRAAEARPRRRLLGLRPNASTRLIDTYLDSGRVDTSRYTTNQLDFTPSTTQERIAEIVVSVFLGFAGLVVLSLLWFARRLYRGATFGRKTSVAVRALLPLLLGFGGWCLGVLIALVALPTVPITDATLAVVSIAPPVALAVYTGWFRSTAPHGVAALAAIACATVGAWLGYQVPHAPGFGAITAIVGATLAANLGLIAVDIAAPATAGVAVPGSAGAEAVAGPA